MKKIELHRVIDNEMKIFTGSLDHHEHFMARLKECDRFLKIAGKELAVNGFVTPMTIENLQKQQRYMMEFNNEDEFIARKQEEYNQKFLYYFRGSQFKVKI